MQCDSPVAENSTAEDVGKRVGYFSGGTLKDKSQNTELGNTLNVKTQIKFNHVKKCVRIKEDLVG